MLGMQDNLWKIENDEKCLDILEPNLGDRVTLSKVGIKYDGLIERLKPLYIQTGYLFLYNRGGGPAIHVSTLSEWFSTSWVFKATKTDSGFEVETENSVYLIQVHK